MPLTSASLLDALRQHVLLDESTLRKAERLQPAFEDPRALALELQRLGWLSPLQVQMVLAGRAAELVLGPYLLLELLGEGGMGQVFKARHRLLKVIRAVKIIRPEALANSEARKRFYREMEAISRMNHPNIVLAHDAGQVGTIHYYVMEFVAGRDLGRLVTERGPLPPAEACDYARQACLGLHHAHDKGLVHRDVKPANLMLTDEKVIKVLDLGLARLREAAATSGMSTATPLTMTGAVVGTPDYMAPEQIEDAHHVDRRADVYALGCSLYELLSGHPPFPGGNALDKLIGHKLTVPRALKYVRPGVSPSLALVVEKMMAKKPDDRFPSAAAVAEALRLCSLETSSSPTPMPGDATVDFAQGPHGFFPSSRRDLDVLPTQFIPGDTLADDDLPPRQ